MIHGHNNLFINLFDFPNHLPWQSNDKSNCYLPLTGRGQFHWRISFHLSLLNNNGIHPLGSTAAATLSEYNNAHKTDISHWLINNFPLLLLLSLPLILIWCAQLWSIFFLLLLLWNSYTVVRFLPQLLLLNNWSMQSFWNLNHLSSGHTKQNCRQ